MASVAVDWKERKPLHVTKRVNRQDKDRGAGGEFSGV
jgi:hypothetical protein